MLGVSVRWLYDHAHDLSFAKRLSRKCLRFSEAGLRRYLERHPAAPLTLRQVDPLIRDLTHYRDVIARKTQEEIPT